MHGDHILTQVAYTLALNLSVMGVPLTEVRRYDLGLPIVTYVGRPAADTTEEEALLNRWDLGAPRFLDVHLLAEQPLYRQIVARGRVMLPMLLAKLDGKSPQWFAALEEISGTNPIRVENEGQVAAMSGDWKQWGLERGIIG
ncbi:MAG: hypothetical protein AB1716_16565 [Planctomycetota bacterium]